VLEHRFPGLERSEDHTVINQARYGFGEHSDTVFSSNPMARTAWDRSDSRTTLGLNPAVGLGLAPLLSPFSFQARLSRCPISGICTKVGRIKADSYDPYNGRDLYNRIFS
jgi:hypothetical protein